MKMVNVFVSDISLELARSPLKTNILTKKTFISRFLNPIYNTGSQPVNVKLHHFFSFGLFWLPMSRIPY